jgi:DNA-binding PucR family transcriptional regulator
MASWERPSPRVAELIRTIATLLLNDPEALFQEIEGALTEQADPQNPVLTDPALAAAIRRNNRAGLVLWASSNISDPGAPVPPNLGPEAMAVARDAVRRGFDQGILEGYRVAQNIAWQRWMSAAFAATSDPEELRELLEVTARSIFTYVDETLAGMAREIEREREELRRGTQAQRLEVVSLILEGAPISTQRASVRLNYELERSHAAAIIWADAPESDPVVLERAAEAVGRAAEALPLMVVASESSVWVWVASEAGPDRPALEAELERLPGVRVALGPPASGMPGFRRSHLDALATQRLLDRASSSLRLASYDEVQVVALTMQDEERATQFVHRTLGEFASAPAELRETARVYLREQSNAARTARVLFTHRNTVLTRLARMAELLPAPLEGRVLQVALALEIVHWMGPPAA